MGQDSTYAAVGEGRGALLEGHGLGGGGMAEGDKRQANDGAEEFERPHRDNSATVRGGAYSAVSGGWCLVLTGEGRRVR